MAEDTTGGHYPMFGVATDPGAILRGRTNPKTQLVNPAGDAQGTVRLIAPCTLLNRWMAPPAHWSPPQQTGGPYKGEDVIPVGKRP
eukprot:8763424-Pyramimonas_sp.AAC.1